MRTTSTAIEKVSLTTPYGTVQLLFESTKECVVLLPDQYTEPPTPHLTLDGVTVEGRLVFTLWGQSWLLADDNERSRCYDAATDHRITEALYDNLAKKLSSLLSQWVESNPDAMQAITRALLRQAIERLQAEIQNLDNQMNVLINQKAEKQAAIQRLEQQLDEETDP